MDPDDIRNEFLKEILADIERGESKLVEHYHGKFPGNDELIAEEYERVVQESQAQETQAVTPTSGTSKQDSSGELLRQLCESPPSKRHVRQQMHIAAGETTRETYHRTEEN